MLVGSHAVPASVFWPTDIIHLTRTQFIPSFHWRKSDALFQRCSLKHLLALREDLEVNEKLKLRFGGGFFILKSKFRTKCALFQKDVCL